MAKAYAHRKSEVWECGNAELRKLGSGHKSCCNINFVVLINCLLLVFVGIFRVKIMYLGKNPPVSSWLVFCHRETCFCDESLVCGSDENSRCALHTHTHTQ